jgi:transposase-like protein
MPRSTVPPEVRAAAIADLQTGDTPADVAKRYGIDRGTVKMWKQRYVAAHENRTVTVSPNPSPIEVAQLNIAELVMHNLRAKLIATQRIAEYVTNPEWLQKQTAAELGELFEHIDRSAVGILDRMAKRGRDDDQQPGGESA